MQQTCRATVRASSTTPSGCRHALASRGGGRINLALVGVGAEEAPESVCAEEEGVGDPGRAARLRFTLNCSPRVQGLVKWASDRTG